MGFTLTFTDGDQPVISIHGTITWHPRWMPKREVVYPGQAGVLNCLFEAGFRHEGQPSKLGWINSDGDCVYCASTDARDCAIRLLRQHRPDVRQDDSLTQEIQTTEIQDNAVLIAQGLARTHGHTWGRVDLSTLPAKLTPEAISRACREQGLITVVSGEEFLPGITCPYVDDCGQIAHTTGSGGHSWSVGAESLRLDWSRPAGTFCSVVITYVDSDARTGVEVVVDCPLSPYGVRFALYSRHILRVLQDTQAAIDVVVSSTGWPLITPDWEGMVVEVLDRYRVDEYADILDQVGGLIENAEDYMATCQYLAGTS
jgi:hypothetical protein